MGIVSAGVKSFPQTPFDSQRQLLEQFIGVNEDDTVENSSITNIYKHRLKYISW